MANHVFKCQPTKALIIQAFLAFLISMISLFAWGFSLLRGYYFVSPLVYKAFFIMDVFVLLPVYTFSSVAVFLRRYDMEVLAMLSGLAIFCTRLAFLLAAMSEPLILGRAPWFVIFLILPLQAWFYALCLGRHLEIVGWGKKISRTCQT